MKNRGHGEHKRLDATGAVVVIKQEMVKLERELKQLLGGKRTTSPDVKPSKKHAKSSGKGRNEIANSGQPPFQIF